MLGTGELNNQKSDAIHLLWWYEAEMAALYV